MYAQIEDWHPHLITDVTPRPDREYPYVVVQVAPALYELWPVRFVAPDRTWPDEDAVVVPHPHPDEHALSERPRDLLVHETRRRAARRQLPMAVVFGPTNAVLVSSDGRAVVTDRPPSGGMRMFGVTPPTGG